MRRLKQITGFLLALTMLLVLCSCTSSGGGDDKKPSAPPSGSPAVQTPDAPATQTPEAAGDEPQYGGTFVLSKNASPSSLFTIYRAGNGNGFTNQAVEMLGSKNPRTNEVEPFLATSFEQDKEAMTVTIRLNEGVMFHDGSELTSEVVRWNFEFMMENGNGGTIYNPAGFECPDDYTLVVQFDAHYLDAIDRLANVQIYSQKTYEEEGLEYCQNNPVGTGPFVFDEYIPDNKITYVRNDSYWQEGLPYLDEYVVRVIPEFSAAMTAFDNGEIDAFNCGSAPINDSMIAMGYENKFVPAFDTYTLFGLAPNSNVESDPWSDPEVRKAVMLYGINYEALAMLSEGVYADPYMQTCIEGSLHYDPEIDKQSYYDLEKAKQMLADAGYPDGFTTDIYTIIINVNFATALQDALKDLNISANVVEVQTTDPRRVYKGTLHLYPGLCARHEF